MISFECDYNNGAHPQVLQKLIDTNSEISLTYGFDRWSQKAREKIRAACECPNADVYFLQGGTQANAVVIDSLIRSFEGVVCAETAHINVHEAGAVEAAGHRVIALESNEGKLNADVLERYMQVYLHDESREHVPQPGMVYITFPTEMGTLYTAQEIEAVYDICRRHALPLFIDGARLGYGLAASPDITLPWLAQHCDAFYIGGTKCGALCGEAVVFTNRQVATPRGFFSNVKRHGALSAKGRLAGVQFDALFTINPESKQLLYLELSRHAITMAARLKEVLSDAGFPFYIDSPTNQQFVIIPNDLVTRLKKDVDFTIWQPYDDRSMLCRFVTSWATTDDDINYLRGILNRE